MQGFWIGLGLSAYYLAFGVVYKFGLNFLKNKIVTFENLLCCLTIVSNTCDGLSVILRNMDNSGKAKLAYKSVFDTLDIQVKISPLIIINRK